MRPAFRSPRPKRSSTACARRSSRRARPDSGSSPALHPLGDGPLSRGLDRRRRDEARSSRGSAARFAPAAPISRRTASTTSSRAEPSRSILLDYVAAAQHRSRGGRGARRGRGRGVPRRRRRARRRRDGRAARHLPRRRARLRRGRASASSTSRSTARRSGRRRRGRLPRPPACTRTGSRSCAACSRRRTTTATICSRRRGSTSTTCAACAAARTPSRTSPAAASSATSSASSPPGCSAEIDWDAWERPPVFEWLARHVEEDELRRVFNLGIGFCAVLREPEPDDLVIGRIV